MATNVCMPALGHTMEKGTIVEWKVSEGNSIAAGDPLVSIETDKSVVDVDSPVGGQVLRLVAGVGDEFPVGQTIAWIGQPGEAVPEEPVPEAAAAKAFTDRVTPLARRLAESHGINADTLQGTGPDGRVTKEDVQKAIARKPR